MSTTPKKLERSRSNKIVGGVCGGVADYLNMDPTLVRVLTAVLTIVTGGVPILAYLVMLFVVPEESRTPSSYPSVPPGPAAGFGSYDPAARRDDAVWGPEGAPWEQRNSTPPAPSAAYRSAPTPPLWAQPAASQQPGASQQPVPTTPVPNDPPPVEPHDPEPLGPSDPEAPVVTPTEPGPSQPTVPTDEGRARPV